MPRALNTYWCDMPNFGDRLTRALLGYFGIETRLATPWNAQLVGVGSILEHMDDQFAGVVLGTGFMWAPSRRRFSRANLLALRGALTQARVEGSRPEVLGDPGLLAPYLLAGAQESRYRLGLIPHYVERQTPDVLRIARQYPDDVLLIDVERRPADVIADVARCDAIVSSSLHGLIVADALGIPNRWIHADAVLGGGFKFRDYYSAFGEQRSPIPLDGRQTLRTLLVAVEAPPAAVGVVQSRLYDLFADLERHLVNDPQLGDPQLGSLAAETTGAIH